jgi:PAS domain S-box-containing protein
LADTSGAPLQGRIRVLHVDDEQDQLSFARILLEDADHEIVVESVSSPFEALDRLSAPPDCVVTDYQMAEMDGIELARKIRGVTDVPVILYTGRGSEEVASAAFAAGVNDYLRKEMDPGHFQVLARRIRHAVESWRMVKHHSVTLDILKTLDKATSSSEAVDSILRIVKRMTGAEAVAIRLRRNGDFPYLVSDGFSESHLSAESSLAAKGETPGLDGMCGNVLQGRTDPSQPYFTKGGSFWTNAASDLAASLGVEAERLFCRGLCMREGYESIALIPLKSGAETIGLLQINDRRKGLITQNLVSFLEETGASIGFALAKAEQEGILRESEGMYRQLAENAADVLFTVDLNGVITYTSKEVNPHIGYTREELVGRSIIDFAPPESREHSLRMFRDTIEGRTVWAPIVIQAKKKDGGTASLEFNPSPMMEGDTLVGVQVVSHDVSLHVSLEKKLKSLHASALSLAGAESPEDVWLKALEALQEALGFKRISVGLVRDDAVHFPRALGATIPQEFSLPLDGRGISVKAIKSRKSQNVGNSLTDPDYYTLVHRKDGTPRDRSNLAVPIIVDDEAVAVFNVQDVKEDAFTEEDVHLTETLALHAASALSRIRQNVAERRYSHRLEVLNRHANALERVSVLKDALVITYDSLVSLGLTSPSISLLRDKVLSVQPVEGKDGIVPLNLPMDGPGITVRAARTGKTQLVNDALSDPDLVPDPEGKHIGSELVAPVKLGDTVIGVLNLESDQPDAYTEEDAKIVEMLAAHFASAYEKIRHIEHDTRDKARIEALHGCALRLSAATTVDEIWEIAIKGLSEALGFSTVSLGLVEGDKIKFHRFIGVNIPPDLTIPLEKSVLARVVKSKSTLLIPDTRLDPHYFTVTRNPDGSNKHLSELATPIVVDGRVYAVLNSESERPNDYGPEDQMLIETLASHVSNAITRVRTLEDLQRTVEQRTSELIAAEQMATAGRVSAMVAHDLRGPLQTISNASQLVRAHPERAGEMIATINSAVEKSLKMLEELRLNTHEDPLRLRATDLPALIAESLKEISPPRGVEIDLRMGEGLGGVMVDPMKVNRVLDNLLRNAVEAMPGGGRLTVAAERVAGEIVLEVADTGPGIPEELTEKLFQPFLTTKAGGLGLGLPYCKKAVEAHGGSISVYSTPGEGATFTVRLPAS